MQTKCLQSVLSRLLFNLKVILQCTSASFSRFQFSQIKYFLTLIMIVIRIYLFNDAYKIILIYFFFNRIYPTYIFCMLISYLFLEVRGPMSTYLKQDVIETCDEKWWKNLSFINNFFNQEKLVRIFKLQSFFPSKISFR